MAIVVSAAAYGAYYMTYGRYHESTDDAYVSGNLVQLTPQVSGTVVAVNADDTQIVKQGDPSSRSTTPMRKSRSANAEATLGQTVRQVSSLYVNNDFYAATVAQRQSDLARADRRPEAPSGGRRNRRGVGRRHRPRARRRERRAGRARRRASAGRKPTMR